jgi:hypothetical protein
MKMAQTLTMEKKKGAKWLTLTKYSEKKTKAKKVTKKSNKETGKETNAK